MKKAIFFDRDGCLVKLLLPRLGQAMRGPRTIDEIEYLPGVPETCCQLKKLGWTLLIVTSQPDVSRGLTTRKEVDVVNEEICRVLGIDDAFVCPHTGADDCLCRKPRPGLLLAAARKWNVSLADSIMIGDSETDLIAGTAAGCAVMLVVPNQGITEVLPWILRN